MRAICYNRRVEFADLCGVLSELRGLRGNTLSLREEIAKVLTAKRNVRPRHAVIVWRASFFPVLPWAFGDALPETRMRGHAFFAPGRQDPWQAGAE